MYDNQIKIDEILNKYKEIMKAERKINRVPELGVPQMTPQEVYYMTCRILEVTKSEFVSRSYNSRYGLSSDEIVFESVAAHTNLASYILDLALDTIYAKKSETPGFFWRTFNGYTHREMIEAMRVHDLGENEIGDIPDNGDRDNEEKDSAEMEYFEKFMASYPPEQSESRDKVLRLLYEMQHQSSFDGRLVYLSDKISALIVTLCLDWMGYPPMMKDISPYASSRDILEMKLCDYSANRAHKASEMWVIDFFKMRELNRFDETTFFTSLIVMTTLVVNGRWYNWREKDYIF